MKNDVIEKVRSADPLGGPQGDPLLDGAEAETLYQSIIASPIERETTARPSLRRKLVFSIAATGTVAALAIGIAVVAPPTDESTRAPRTADTVLREIALVAERQPPTVAEPGQFYYEKSEGAYLGVLVSVDGGNEDFMVIQSAVSERWYGTDGSGRYLTHDRHTEFISEEEEERWKAAGSPDLGIDDASRTEEEYKPGELSLYAAGLPSDPDELYERLEREASGHSDPEAELFVLATDYLRAPDATPELRAALFEVIRRAPRVELVGQVTDPKGRPGTAVAIEHTYTGWHVRDELIFDEETSAVLAERSVIADGPLPPQATPPSDTSVEPGTVISYTVNLDQGIVDSTQERP